MLLSLLITVLIMGGLGAFVLNGVGSTSLNIPTTIAVPTTGRTTTSSTVSVQSAALQAACIEDADALSTALSDYEELSGVTLGVETGINIGVPTSYGDGHDATTLIDSSYLSSWPQPSEFALSISTQSAGDIAVYVPANSRHPVLFNEETSKMGCNAL